MVTGVAADAQGIRARHGSAAARVGGDYAVGAHRRSLRVDYLHDLAPATGARMDADGTPARRSDRGGDPTALRGAAVAVVANRPAAESRASASERNRRTRIRSRACELLVTWLHRVARCHAHLCAIVRLYGDPSKAGGQSNQGETYAARAARGDRTLLYDAITVTIDELVEIRDEIQTSMDAAEPTEAAPGTTHKVDEMAARAERGESLFVQGDARQGREPVDGSAG